MFTLEEVRAKLRAVLDQRAVAETEWDTIINTVSAEKRSASPVETARVEEIRTAITALDMQKADLEKSESDLVARAAAREAAEKRAAEFPSAKQVVVETHGGAKVKKEERTYTQQKNSAGVASFFSDAFNAERGDFNARGRLDRHSVEVRAEGEGVESRATNTTSFAGLVVPQYLVELAALALRNGRPVANVCTHMTLPDQGMSLIIPRGTTAATEASQVTENTSVSSTDEVWANLTVPVVTIAGQQDVSRQSLERGMPGIDQLIYADLAGAYHAELDRQVINGSGASNQMLGILQTAGIGAATAFGAVPTATNFSLKVAGQVAAVSSAGAQVCPQIIAMHPRRWGWENGLVDSSGRPIVIPTDQGPFNVLSLLKLLGNSASEPGAAFPQLSTTLARIVGMMQGLDVITDLNIPINVGTNVEDIVIVFDPNQAFLWEQGDKMPRLFRFEQTLGNQLTTKLVTYGYAAFTAGRYPSAFGKIGGLDSVATQGLVAPSF